MAAGFLQLLRPDDVVLLIKSALSAPQVPIPVFRSPPPAARAAMIGEFPLTRYRVCLIASTSGSLAALLHKIHHRIKGLVRMHQENITFPDIREDIIIIHQCRNRLRRIFRCL